MQSNETVIGKKAVFTSSSSGNKVAGAKAKYLDGFNITINGLVNGTPDGTEAKTLGLLNPFEVQVGGVPQIRMRAIDIYALNVLALQHLPRGLVSTSDDNEFYMEGLWCPAWWPPTLAETVVNATFVSQAAIDGTELTITAEFLDKKQKKPALYYQEAETEMSGVDSTAFGNGGFTINLIGDLIGLLFFVDTETTAAVLMEDGTIQQIRITAGGRILGLWEWHEISGLPNMFGGQLRGVQLEETGSDANISKYQWLPFTREPIPRGTQVQVDFMSGASDTVRLVPMQAIRLQTGLAKGR